MRLIESEIKELKLKILDMAELVRVQFDQCIQALDDLNRDLASRIVKREDEVDSYDTRIARRCERIIALYQPVANDLRFVFTALRINDFLEQAGDQVSGIANKILAITGPFAPELLDALQLRTMERLTQAIFQKSLRAYFYERPDECKLLFHDDDAIDAINRAAFDILVRTIQDDPARTADYLHLLHIIRHLEKIGDFAVAIAEEAIFHAEGIVYRHTEMKFNPAARAQQTPVGQGLETSAELP
ncbi:MAG: phosphate signaling complex protein PhoU [Bacteroidia bacterium]|nr:phosphate signaling complex protein PhoU [Bacteroidia bacterium]